MQLLGVELEKVVGEQLRYTCESNGVDVGAVEYFVYVGAAAWQLSRQPWHCSAAVGEHAVDFFPDVYHVAGGVFQPFPFALCFLSNNVWTVGLG